MNVRARMNANPVAIDAKASLEQALDRMTAHGMRHLPVIDAERKFLGVVREYAVRSALLAAGGAKRFRVVDYTEFGVLVLHLEERLPNARTVLHRSPGLDPLPVVRARRLEGTISHRELNHLLREAAPPAAMQPREEKCDRESPDNRFGAGTCVLPGSRLIEAAAPRVKR